MTTRRQLLKVSTSWSGASILANAIAGVEPDQPVSGCERNLKLIYDGVVEFRHRLGRLPWDLTELATSGLLHKNYLVCPSHHRTGAYDIRTRQLKNSLASDPLTLYRWEFSNREDKLAGKVCKVREYKERQRVSGLGDWVAMVRCGEHDFGEEGDQLNLSCGGALYRSGTEWERNFVDLCPYPYSFTGLIWKGDGNLRSRVKKRSKLMTDQQVDLSPAINGLLEDGWAEGYDADSMAEFVEASCHEGVFDHGGVLFDARGVVQVDGTSSHMAPDRESRCRYFPRKAVIPLQPAKMAKKAHVLAGAIHSDGKGDSSGMLTLRRRDGSQKVLDILYDIHVSHSTSGPAHPRPGDAVVWSRTAKERSGNSARSLCHIIWELDEHTEITTVEISGGSGKSSLFIAAITVE